VRRYDNKAFTIIELLVAMALLVAMLAISGMVFKMAVDAHRRADATGQVTRKLRAIVNQLDADFRGLNEQGEVTMVWVPVPMDAQGKAMPPATPFANVHHYGRFDRVVFFANGNFQSYGKQPPLPPPLLPNLIPVPVTPETLPIRNAGGKLVQGDMALICYMPANDSAGIAAKDQLPKTRILARSQHILASDVELVGLPNTTTGQTYPLYINPTPGNLLNAFTPNFISRFEYLNLSLLQWLYMDTPGQPMTNKRWVLSQLTGVSIPSGIPAVGGLSVDPHAINTQDKNIHMLLCEGVGEFSVQSWHNAAQRWFPDIVRNPDGTIASMDFSATGNQVNPLVLPWSPDSGYAFSEDPANSGVVGVGGIGGIGRALKFTFTLYDSHGVFKNGKTFTHIVYLK
jgi:prepilin-type N-terminal cleavage/methylation domain-containing protein